MAERTRARRPTARTCPRCALAHAEKSARRATSQATGPRTEICGLCSSLEAAAELTGAPVAPVATWPLTPARLAREYRALLELARSPAPAGPSLSLRRAPHRIRGVPDRLDIQALNVAGDRWSLMLVKILNGRPRRETEIKRELTRLCSSPTGGAPSTGQLAARLRQLVDDGLCRRERHREMPPRVEYKLTDAGVALVPLVDAIEAWGRAWAPRA